MYRASSYTGEVTESDEMAPRWFKLSDIPYDDMWADDRLWLPLCIAGKRFQGRAHFRGMDTLLSHDIQVVDVVDEGYAHSWERFAE